MCRCVLISTDRYEILCILKFETEKNETKKYISRIKCVQNVYFNQRVFLANSFCNNRKGHKNTNIEGEKSKVKTLSPIFVKPLLYWFKNVFASTGLIFSATFFL